MLRRNFLKVAVLGLCGKRPKSEHQEIPPLPPVEYFQEHNKSVWAFSADYRARQEGEPALGEFVSWWGSASRFISDKKQKNESWREYLRKKRVDLAFVDGKWIAVECMKQTEYG